MSDSRGKFDFEVEENKKLAAAIEKLREECDLVKKELEDKVLSLNKNAEQKVAMT